MSDAIGVVSNFLSVDEILTPQFLYPVCGVILCAVAVFLVGVGFRSSSEPKFQISGDGDGVPFLKKKKKQKGVIEKSITTKKAQSVSSTTSKSVKARRSDEYFDRDSLLFQPSVDRDGNDTPTTAVADDWITAVSRKEKRGRRRHENISDAEVSNVVEAESVPSRTVEVIADVPEIDVKPVQQVSAIEKKGRASAKAERQEASKKLSTEQRKAEPEIVVKKEEESKGKKSKQKQKQIVESHASTPPIEETPKPAVIAEDEPRAIPVSPSASSSKKKKKAATSVSAAAPEPAFQLAEFELPTTVAQTARQTSPSPPSTDSSFELVDADAVREAIEEVEEEKEAPRSRTSGASKKKNKKSTPTKIVEEVAPAATVPVPEEPKPTSEPPPTTSAESHDWQDAKATRKRRRVRRDD